MNAKATKGFTLIELIVVIVLLGVMSVGISGFMGLTTQIYVNVSDRDELMSSARFVVERLNREIRQAVPNSIRIAEDSGTQCIEFIPTVASTVYTELPTAPDPASSSLTVIEFNANDNSTYNCSNCGDYAIVYPLNPSEIYESSFNDSGKIFEIRRLLKFSLASTWRLIWTEGSVLFDEESPTQRIYIASEQVSYCLVNQQIRRYSQDIGGTQLVPPSVIPSNNNVLMAENMAELSTSGDVFNYTPATLQRNAIVQTNLHFIRNDETIVFNNEIHIPNVP